MNPTHTSCKNCIFAEYEENTQVGCTAGRLDVFRNREEEIIEAYDEEKEFYVIDKRICMYKRPESWKHADLPHDEQITTIKEEIKIPLHVIIMGEDFDDICKTINSLVAQEVQPAHITVLRPYGSVLHDTKIRTITSYLDQSGIPWKLQNILNPDVEPEKYEDLVVDIAKPRYYMTLNAGCEIPSDTIRILNEKINEELFRFYVLTPNSEGNGWTVPWMTYQLFNGNKKGSLLDKLKDNQCQLHSINQIVPSFPE